MMYLGPNRPFKWPPGEPAGTKECKIWIHRARWKRWMEAKGWLVMKYKGWQSVFQAATQEQLLGRL